MLNNIYLNPEKCEWPQIISRPAFDTSTLVPVVKDILEDVKLNGDKAVKNYTQKFDKVSLDDFRVTGQEMSEAESLVSQELKAAILVAKNNIEKFHSAQIGNENKVETTTGVICWRKSVAIQKVGLYIPGGSAPLFSTLLMLGIPAIISGCKHIAVCSPANDVGTLNPVILYVAKLLGLKNILKIGGVQAIAAMGYGTESIAVVDKIFGPGNQYVTCAKQLISQDGVAIDMPAGPSEVAIYADETADVSFIAADLLSQAEHGADSQVFLVASSNKIVNKVQDHIRQQLSSLPRKEIAIQALAHSRFVVMENIIAAFDLLNEYAPEHLIIASDNAGSLLEKVVNAGSIFLGHYSPESVGDYASGTNHTLPTSGYAKTYSGVSVDSFIKKITVQHLSKTGLRNIGETVQRMAAAEGLDAHKNAVSIRLDKIISDEI